jgi:hypothetical protein
MIALALILALAASAAAYTYTSYDMTAEHTKTFRTPDGVYLIGYSGRDVQIERLAPDPVGATLSLRYAVNDVGVFDGTVVAVCGDRENHQLIVYTYEIDSDILDSFAVGGADFTDGFYVDRKGVWLIGQNDRTVMNRYNRTGRMTGSYSFPNIIDAVIDSDGCGYAVSAGALYRLDGDTVTRIAGARVNTPLCCIGGGMLSDVSGRIYALSGDSLNLLYTLESGSRCASACVTDGSVYYPVGDTVYRYDAEDGEKTGYIHLDDTITAMFDENGVICAVNADGTVINRISPSEFTSLQNQSQSQNQNSSNNSNHNQNQNSNQQSGNIKQDGIISSDIYRVDNYNLKITGISSPTTFAQFKSRMHYDGYTARLYRGGKEIKTGNVGTAMTVVFSNDRQSYTYELGVTGDLTGEGNVNSRDLGDLMGYLIGTVTFNGVYTDAADLSGDGAVDVIDLALLCRTVG